MSLLSISLDPVELLRCLGVGLRILTSDRKTHSVPPTDITANHTLVSDILPHFSLQLCLNPQLLQPVCPPAHVILNCLRVDGFGWLWVNEVGRRSGICNLRCGSRRREK